MRLVHPSDTRASARRGTVPPGASSRQLIGGFSCPPHHRAVGRRQDHPLARASSRPCPPGRVRARAAGRARPLRRSGRAGRERALASAGRRWG